ncbi:MAG: MgtC/SapB family protein [Armatimonadota bacterium]|nr:MgtC/SapB family protein [Armatimonadota bacterium]MDW8156282.1 MgtC/SapB family protein [Armatimonadota bacterium]
MEPLELAGRLVLAVVLGGIIGIEREVLEKPAGFRTHILVALGAATFTLISLYGFFGTGADPARIASNIVVGIGFIGAGTIWRHPTGVGGLTTAASLWMVAAIGTAAASGFYLVALLATGLAWAVLHLFPRVERWLPRRATGLGVLAVTMADRPGQLGALGTLLGQHKANIESVEMEAARDGKVSLHLGVRLPPHVRREDILMAVADLEGVEAASWTS